MSKIRPPARGIVSAEGVPDGMIIGCDCGFTTHVVIHIDGGHGPGALAYPAEAAFTCGGCQTAHWFTVYPPDGRDGAA